MNLFSPKPLVERLLEFCDRAHHLGKQLGCFQLHLSREIGVSPFDRGFRQRLKPGDTPEGSAMVKSSLVDAQQPFFYTRR
jgi:hypothetical protein